MLNGLWAGMIVIGVIWGGLHGTLGEVTSAMLSGAGNAVTLCLTMLGILSFWTGMLEIGERSDLLAQVSGFLRPFLHFLFPSVPEEHPALRAISTNVVANMLGLGWAATPAGLTAMEELQKFREEFPGKGKTSKDRETATNEMCNFLILNMSSLQLIPINMIAYRAQYGSVNPAAILVPALVATTASTLAGIGAIKLFERIWP